MRMRKAQTKQICLGAGEVVYPREQHTRLAFHLALALNCWVTLCKSQQVRSAPPVSCLKCIQSHWAGKHFPGQQKQHLPCQGHPPHRQISCPKGTQLALSISTWSHPYIKCFTHTSSCHMAIYFFLHLKLWYNVRSVLQLTRVAFNCMKVVLHVLEQGIGMCVLLVTLLLGQHWRTIYNMGTWCGVTFNSSSISLFSNLSSELTRVLSQWEIISCLQNTSILSKDTQPIWSWGPGPGTE